MNPRGPPQLTLAQTPLTQSINLTLNPISCPKILNPWPNSLSIFLSPTETKPNPKPKTDLAQTHFGPQSTNPKTAQPNPSPQTLVETLNGYPKKPQTPLTLNPKYPNPSRLSHQNLTLTALVAEP